MDPHLWVAFATASLLMAVVPGPGVASMIGFAVGSGPRTALASVAGMALGNLIAMSLSLMGIGGLLAASALAFTVLKFAGALYLVVLGLRTIARARCTAVLPVPPVAPRTAFLTNVAVGTFHPKTILFFIALPPQFISPSLPYMTQALLMIATFTGIAAVTDTLYALTASKGATALQSPGSRLWAKRGSGGVLVAAGVATAWSRS